LALGIFRASSFEMPNSVSTLNKSIRSWYSEMSRLARSTGSASVTVVTPVLVSSPTAIKKRHLDR
jgi:hypothetical protein